MNLLPLWPVSTAVVRRGNVIMRCQFCLKSSTWISGELREIFELMSDWYLENKDGTIMYFYLKSNIYNNWIIVLYNTLCISIMRIYIWLNTLAHTCTYIRKAKETRLYARTHTFIKLLFIFPDITCIVLTSLQHHQRNARCGPYWYTFIKTYSKWDNWIYPRR